MQLSEINNTFQHRITGGSDYLWDCYGSNTWSIDYTSKYANGYVIFDTETQKVYEVSVSPDATAWAVEPKPYRYIDPAYRISYETEAKDRNVDPNVAWDDTKWVDLETEEDFIDKASKMFVGEKFDTRIQVPLDLDNDTILKLSMEAHKRDITLNQMVEELLRNMIAQHELNIA
jgi:hypothetical protein